MRQQVWSFSTSCRKLPGVSLALLSSREQQIPRKTFCQQLLVVTNTFSNTTVYSGKSFLTVQQVYIFLVRRYQKPATSHIHCYETMLALIHFSVYTWVPQEISRNKSQGRSPWYQAIPRAGFDQASLNLVLHALIRKAESRPWQPSSLRSCYGLSVSLAVPGCKECMCIQDNHEVKICGAGCTAVTPCLQASLCFSNKNTP